MATVPGPWPHAVPRDPSLLPPQNLEAEAGVIGSVLIDNAALAALGPLEPGHFWRDAHQVLFRAALDLHAAGKPVDAITLCDELRRRDQLEEAGGEAYVGDLMAGVPHTANASYYADLVREKAAHRAILDATAAAADRVYSNHYTAAEVGDFLRGELLRVECESSGWEDAETDDAPAAPPFPLDVLPESLARFVAAHAALAPCPPDYIAVTCLAVAGGAIGRSVAIRPKRKWVEYANLWVPFVGTAGTAKSYAQDVAAEPLKRLDREMLDRHRALVADAKREAAADKHAGRKNDDPDRVIPLRQVVVNDSTIEALARTLENNPRGVVTVHDELSAWVTSFGEYKSGGGGDMARALSLWSCASWKISRKNQLDGVPISVAHPFFAVTGPVVPAKLHLFGVDKDGNLSGDGFFERMLFSFPAEVLADWTDDDDTDAADGEWADAVKRLHNREMVEGEYGPRPYYLDFTADGRARWVEWVKAHCDEMKSPDFPAELKGAWSKFRSQCARLILVVDRVRDAYDPAAPATPAPVGLKSVEDGVRLAEYFKAHMKRVLAYLRNRNEDDRLGRAVLEWAAARPAPFFTVRQAKANFRRRLTQLAAGALDDSLARLEARHCVRRVVQSGRDAGRRTPSPTYEVHPAIFKSAPVARARP